MPINLLSKPLSHFHHEFTSVIGKLPRNGKVQEISKRIIVVAVSPFAYLALGFLALVGQSYALLSKSKNGAQPTVDFTEKVKHSLLAEITNAMGIHEIQSIKLYFNLTLNKKSFQRDYIIRKVNFSGFDSTFFMDRINLIIHEFNEMMKKNQGSEQSVVWEAFIKDKNVLFTKVSGAISEGTSPSVVRGSKWKNIPLKRAEKTFEVVLVKMGREIRPQLDYQAEFIT